MFIHPCLLLIISLYACTINAADRATTTKEVPIIYILTKPNSYITLITTPDEPDSTAARYIRPHGELEICTEEAHLDFDRLELAARTFEKNSSLKAHLFNDGRLECVDTLKDSDADKKSAADSKEKKRESDDFHEWVMIKLAQTDESAQAPDGELGLSDSDNE